MTGESSAQWLSFEWLLPVKGFHPYTLYGITNITAGKHFSSFEVLI